eukprot:3628605-Rhodomonas_salina.1
MEAARRYQRLCTWRCLRYRDTETQTQTQTDTQTHRHRGTQTQTHRHTATQTQRFRSRGSSSRETHSQKSQTAAKRTHRILKTQPSTLNNRRDKALTLAPTPCSQAAAKQPNLTHIPAVGSPARRSDRAWRGERDRGGGGAVQEEQGRAAKPGRGSAGSCPDLQTRRYYSTPKPTHTAAQQLQLVQIYPETNAK